MEQHGEAGGAGERSNADGRAHSRARTLQFDHSSVRHFIRISSTSNFRRSLVAAFFCTALWRGALCRDGRCAVRDPGRAQAGARHTARAPRGAARGAPRAPSLSPRGEAREARGAARGSRCGPSAVRAGPSSRARASRRPAKLRGRPPARAAGARRWRWRLHPDAPRHFANSASQPGRGRFGRRRRDAAAAGAAAGGEAEDEASGGEDDAEGPGRALSIVSGASPARPPSGTLTRR